VGPGRGGQNSRERDDQRHLLQGRGIPPERAWCSRAYPFPTSGPLPSYGVQGRPWRANPWEWLARDLFGTRACGTHPPRTGRTTLAWAAWVLYGRLLC
jgi:hypothetical protein